MTKVKTIKCYPSHLDIIDADGDSHSLNIDGQAGEFTRDEWRDNDTLINEFNDPGREKILNSLDGMANKFFAE